jgi:predicted SnoaL-like aldol condensation-catalyzing enzyme
MTTTEIAHNFLHMIVAGKVEEVYSTYISSDFRHHNQYTPGDTQSLKQGMIENHENFPTKEYTLHQTIAQDDKVLVHGLMKLNDNLQVAVVHIFRFEGDKIAELWDV